MLIKTNICLSMKSTNLGFVYFALVSHKMLSSHAIRYMKY